MDEKEQKIKILLSNYDGIKDIESFKCKLKYKYGLKFKLFEVTYAICVIDEMSFPTILILDNECKYPHFALEEHKIGGVSYRSVCLFETGTLIEYIHSFEEKIKLCIERLIRLVKMSHNEIVKEYQKEFLVYWNAMCIEKGQYGQYEYSLFLDDDNHYQWLEQEVFEDKKIRITKCDRFFNDSKYRITVQTAPVLFLPIIDPREIIPSIAAKPWGAKEVNDIIQGIKYQRISHSAYEEIKSTEFHKKEIMLIFKLSEYCFGCIVKFSDSRKNSLLNKFDSNISDVFPVKIFRCDFQYLNNQIGNKTSEKKIAIIGAGSLGSYVSNELAHAGFKKFLIVDSDKYEYANTFRHRLDCHSNNISKSKAVAFSLNLIHPEIKAKPIDEYLTEENYDKIIKRNQVDLIIFTVGSSDVQLRMNKKFIEENISIPIYYAWLEHDGETSHLAIINNYYEGCFECLYTNGSGELCENTVNKADKSTIRYIKNGCNGTRVPYGNKTLLTSSAMILKAINDNKQGNWLYSYHNDQIIIEKFPKNSECKCCGVHL